MPECRCACGPICHCAYVPVYRCACVPVCRGCFFACGCSALFCVSHWMGSVGSANLQMRHHTQTTWLRPRPPCACSHDRSAILPVCGSECTRSSTAACWPPGMCLGPWWSSTSAPPAWRRCRGGPTLHLSVCCTSVCAAPQCVLHLSVCCTSVCASARMLLACSQALTEASS